MVHVEFRVLDNVEEKENYPNQTMLSAALQRAAQYMHIYHHLPR